MKRKKNPGNLIKAITFLLIFILSAAFCMATFASENDVAVSEDISNDDMVIFDADLNNESYEVNMSAVSGTEVDEESVSTESSTEVDETNTTDIIYEGNNETKPYEDQEINTETEEAIRGDDPLYEEDHELEDGTGDKQIDPLEPYEIENSKSSVEKAPIKSPEEESVENIKEDEKATEEETTEENKERTEKEQIKIKEISLDKTEANLDTQKTLELKVKIIPENATEEIIWTSSNEKIATVDKDGKVTALRYGSAVITASNESGNIKAVCKIKTRYMDVNDPSEYYYTPVYWAADKGITRGYDNVYFGPKRNCTRREMMIFLWRYAGKPATTGTIPFSDVKYAKTTDSYKAILWGSKNGLIKGYNDGTFRPDAEVVRKDAMIMLYRLAGRPSASGNLKFTDVLGGNYSISSDTYRSILWGYNINITNGYADGTFKMFDSCLREHIVTFLYRYENNKTRLANVPDELIIMLDPGHDRKHPGAAIKGFNEYEMNLKIAKACKAELEKYKGVKVYMTRYTNQCAYPNGTAGNELILRVNTAKQMNADVLISLHINAGGGKNQKGIMTIPQVPTKTWRTNLSKISTALGEYMRTELMKLGFKSAGRYYRYNTVNYRYPDGSLADYYGICLNGTLKNIPSLIVEHGYIDKDDIKLLNTDAKLRACGVADATGIAKYYGLTKK